MWTDLAPITMEVESGDRPGVGMPAVGEGISVRTHAFAGTTPDALVVDRTELWEMNAVIIAM